QLFEAFRAEGYAVSNALEDFLREYLKDRLPKLTPQERAEVLQALPPEERLAGLSVEQIRQYLDRMTTERKAPSRRPRRKKQRAPVARCADRAEPALENSRDFLRNP